MWENIQHWFNRYFVDNGAHEWWLTGLKTTLLVTLLALVIGVWCALGFGVSRLDITFFHTPLWAITGCLGTWIFSILAVWWLIKRVFRDFDLDEEEE